ncbi:hypothetical protein DS745_07985 [Anaerobacillus alkaliphilus]|uniref:Uncharacterized protein n=1 Tax=Anaerobacillus alkaliphilus TaxID=1548597 RepID=A0A4Q0VTR3_9BACI|nr:YppG family protein [Anaerobacillus alkaliphilus]RXJ02024.1 hypothetical protein DS745_07985 [Anaerobacillus alkaliphilus]
MFPQRNRTMQHPYSYYHQMSQQQQVAGMQPQRRGMFGARQTSHQGMYPQQMPMQYYQQPQQRMYVTQQQQMPVQQPKQSFFRNEQGQIDFQKIGGGVQTVMGLVNQVSPMMKMLGGFIK